MNYKEAMEYMEETAKYGSVLGLDSMRELCTRLGNPQEQLRFIHIAGTNGKGSVLAYISTVLKSAGYKVGRYISPVIFEYRERIQVNGRMITKQGLCDCLMPVREAARQMKAEGLAHPTPFEIETAVAFLYFKMLQCDIVVLETGLGGSLDATNVINNTIASVFTSVSMDHMQFLGDTQELIAESKAGIIKKNCHVISTEQKPEAAAVLRKKAEELGCPFHMVDSSQISKIKYGVKQQRFTYKNEKDLVISLAGQYQIMNCALAVETINVLAQCGFPVRENALRKGLLETEWKGRFTAAATKPLFIADGAHNEDAARRLAESIRFYFTNKRIIYIMGMLRDKEYGKIIRLTCGLAEHIITVTAPGNQRAMSACDLAKEVRELHPCVTAADSLEEAVELSFLLADKDSVIVAFGSLSYLGDIIRIVENKDKIRSDSHGKQGKN